MKKTLCILICIVCAASFLLAGCGSKSVSPDSISVDTALLGSWERADSFGSEYTFEKDGTGKDTFWGQPFTYNVQSGMITITYDKPVWGEDQLYYRVTDEGFLEMWENSPTAEEPEKILFYPEGYEAPTEEETPAE